MKVTISSLDFGYRDRSEITPVFADFNLEIESRTMHSIVGPSGCGKTTLLRLIAGVEQPRRGSVSFRGAAEAANRTALVFQDPTLLPWWSTKRNVGIGLEFDRRRTTLYQRSLAFALDRVGLRNVAERLPHTLSKGQGTRASIARAMAYDADVTLLDEPFVHLDLPTRRTLWQEFETHWQLEARTYILVTHDIAEAVLLSDRVTVLSGGQSTSVVETIDVGLARPRGLSRMESPAFRAAVARVWEALDDGTTP